VEVTPTTPAQVTDIPIRSGQRLRTVSGTVEQLLTKAIEFGDDYLRVWVNEPTRAGLRDQIADALPNALEIRIHPDFATATSGRKVTVDHASRTPGQLFADYCAAEDVADARVATLFGQLHDQVTHPSI
jgi:exonuclease SbcD